MSTEIDKLRALCQAWGGDLIELPKGEFEKLPDHISCAPFSNFLGIDWEAKRIYFEGCVLWYEVVHEMGHVFACTEAPQNVKDELLFFGWEIALAEIVGDVWEWRRTNRNYDLGGEMFGDLSERKQERMLNDCKEDARKRGLIAGNTPLAIR